MQKESAIATLLQVARLAQKAGILSLEDAVVVASAVKVLSIKNEETNEKARQESVKSSDKGSEESSKES